MFCQGLAINNPVSLPLPSFSILNLNTYIVYHAYDRMMEADLPKEGFLLFDRYYFSTIAYNLAHKHTMEASSWEKKSLYFIFE